MCVYIYTYINLCIYICISILTQVLSFEGMVRVVCGHEQILSFIELKPGVCVFNVFLISCVYCMVSIYWYKYKYRLEYNYEYEYKCAYRYVYMNAVSSLNRAQAGGIFVWKTKYVGYSCIVCFIAFREYIYRCIFSSRYFLLLNSSRGYDFFFEQVLLLIHIYIYVYIIHIYMIHIYTYIIHMYIYIYVCINIDTYMNFFLYVCMHVYIYSYKCTYV